jgi:hypothetical protein
MESARLNPSDLLALVQSNIATGLACLEGGEVARAGQLLFQAGQMLSSYPPPHSAEVQKALLSYLTAFGVFYLTDGNASAALSFFLDVARRQSLTEVPTACEGALTALHICDSLGRLGRYAEAKKYAEGAVMIIMADAMGPGGQPTGALRDPTVQTLLAVAHLRAGAASEALEEPQQALTAYSWGMEVAASSEHNAQLRTTLEEALLRAAETLKRMRAGGAAASAAAAAPPQGEPALQQENPHPPAEPPSEAASFDSAPSPRKPSAAVIARTPADTRPPYPPMLDATRRILGLKLPSEREQAKVQQQQQQQQQQQHQRQFSPPRIAKPVSNPTATGTASASSTSRPATRSSSSPRSSSLTPAAAAAAQAGLLQQQQQQQRPMSRGSIPAVARLLTSPFAKSSPRVIFKMSSEGRAHERSLRPEWNFSASTKSMKELQLEDARLKLSSPLEDVFAEGSSSSSNNNLWGEGESSLNTSDRASLGTRSSSRGPSSSGRLASREGSRPLTREGGDRPITRGGRSVSTNQPRGGAPQPVGAAAAFLEHALQPPQPLPTLATLPSPSGWRGVGPEAPSSWVLEGAGSSLYEFQPLSFPDAAPPQSGMVRPVSLVSPLPAPTPTRSAAQMFLAGQQKLQSETF